MRTADSYKLAKPASVKKKVITSLLVVIVISALLRFFFVETYSVAGVAMVPGQFPGGRLLINRMVFGLRIPPFRALRIFSFSRPAYGDAVFFYHPWRTAPSGLAVFVDYLSFGVVVESGRELLFRRVAAVPGDLVRLDRFGLLYRNGKRISEQRGKTVDFSIKPGGAGSVVLFAGHSVGCLKSKVRVGSVSLRLVKEGGYRVLVAGSSGYLRPFPGAVGSGKAPLGDFVWRFFKLNRDFSDEKGVEITSGNPSSKNIAVFPGTDGGVGYILPGEKVVRSLIIRRKQKFWLRVPAGFFFLLGDNRVFSSDSRNWGLVSAKRLEGSLLFRLSR